MTTPIPVAAACIVRPGKNEVLLAQRNQPSIPLAHLKWELPGGKIEFCELPEETVVREINEELGLSVRVGSLLPHVQTNVWEQPDRRIHTLIVCFECYPTDESQVPTPSDPKVADARFFHIDEIEWEKTLMGTREFINCLIEPPRGTTSDIYVRLEKHDSEGRRTHFFEVYQSRTMEGLGTEMIVREAAMARRNPRQHVGSFHFRHGEALEELRKKVKSRLERGYVIKSSQPDPASLRLALGL